MKLGGGGTNFQNHPTKMTFLIFDPKLHAMSGVKVMEIWSFFYFGGGWWMVGGGWWATFWFFKSLHNNMVYTLDIYTCMHIVFISVQNAYCFKI